jgi:hypothetical protein
MLVGLGASIGTESDLALAQAEPQWRWLFDVTQATSLSMVPLVLFVFPTGTFVPRWTAVAVLLLVAWALAAAFAVDFNSDSLASNVIAAVFLIFILAGLASQYYRYRRVSGPSERQQTKWIVLGFAAMVLGMTLWIVPLDVLDIGASKARLYYNIFGLAFLGLLVPFFAVCLLFSILRYRLWDIDILINRALVYGASTASLGLVYFGSVVVLQAVFRGITGQESGLAVVVSTLVIAALFVPLRGRIQAVIDRRFYRSRYDAEQTLATFGVRARDEVDLERLSGALVGVVEDTMKPAHASLWLRET